MSEPRSLSSVLHALLEGQRREHSSDSSDPGEAVPRLAFTGNWQDPCPRQLLLDPSLEPVDIVTWQVIRIHAEPGRLVAFPTYRDLMQWVRVSRATVARAVTVLRLARWLPLSVSIRDADGRFQGNVYALQDEPMPLVEMLRIDDRYVRFAEQSCTHRHAHVRKLGREVCRTIHDAVAASDSTALEPAGLSEHIAVRFDRMIQLFEHDTKATARTDHGCRGSGVQDLNSAPSQPPASSPVQDLNLADGVQNLNSGRKSSSKKSKTTTTSRPKSEAPRTPEVRSSCTFPAELSLTDSQQRVLELKLQSLPDALRQDVLDEAAARILAKRRTADPVRCEFDYIARLAARALNGEFVMTDIGERLRQTRMARIASEARLKRAREYSEARRQEEVAAHNARQSASGRS